MVAAAVLSLSLVACGDDTPEATETPTASTSPSESSPPPEATASATPDPTPTAEPEPAEQVIAITIEGDKTTPNGERIKVAAGEPVIFEITSDRPGELHIHGKPESYVNFGAGTTREEIVIDLPGVVEVEDHDTGFVIAQLEVS
jgi:hypothetical protein